MQIDFEKKLTKMGLSFGVHRDGLYAISNQTGDGNPITIRLISSLPFIKGKHGIKNGKEVQGIGKFKFKLPLSGLEPDILSFAFPNTVKNRVEFIIIPSKEFLRRHAQMNPKSVRRKGVEMVFWLMKDGSVYDTTNISPEGEWFFLSKGLNGRVADGSELDYSEYMKNWRRLIV